MSEEWRPVVGFEGLYEVSNIGRVRSSRRRGSDGRILNIKPSPGCEYVRIRLYRGGKPVAAKKVHRLVLEAFVSLPPPGADACHNNGIRNDNRVENLRWGTRRENYADAKQHGTAAVMERNGQAKLTVLAVAEIRELRSGGASYASLAQRYGVNSATIWSAVVGRTWR